MRKLRLFLLAIFMFLSLPRLDVKADNASLTLTAIYQESVPITLDLASSTELWTLDPAQASDSTTIEAIENLFLGLTDLDPFTGEITPELATHWEISPDGKVWTFHLRDDVNWYHYDPSTETAETIRPVVAQDVVYGIKRACDPRLGGYYGTIAAQIVKGCEAVNDSPDSEVDEAFVFGETTQVRALDEWTVEIKLQESAGYFLSMTSMWMLRPVPQEAIEEFCDEWTQPSNIITNSAYFLHENTRGVRREVVRNENFNADLWHGGNIERVNVTMIEDSRMSLENRGGTILMLYKDNLLDISSIPRSEQEAVLQNTALGDELMLMSDYAVFYFAFYYGEPPFDSVHVRRAFSAIIDRERFIDEIIDGQGIPMLHFTPPEMIGAPPSDEVGVGFDPEYARKQMELGGYPNCENFPEIGIVTYDTAEAWGEFLIQSAIDYLGCLSQSFNIEGIPISAFGAMYPPPDCDTITQDRANISLSGWGADYPDANNWLNDVLYYKNRRSICRPHNYLIDNIILEAAYETDQTRRAEMYHQIEEDFFGEEGEFPIVPIYMRANYQLVKSWYTGPFETDVYSGQHWDAYTIDMDAKLAAQNGN